ncbi:MAG: OmpA family protein [Nitrospirae bacterium]|nr:MAG: OmpA family protein [Nitrospirota bacterium]
MIEGIAMAVVLGWACQKPMVPEVGTGRAEPGYHWVVQADAACREPSLKQVEEQERNEEQIQTIHAALSEDILSSDSCGDREIQRVILYFESGSSEPSNPEVLKLVPLMRQRILAMRVRGFTDPSGSDEFNRRLSRERAEAVWRIWKVMGGPMPADRVVIQGLGECCSHGVDPAKDRRVELEIVSEPHPCQRGRERKEVGTRGKDHTRISSFGYGEKQEMFHP